MNAADLTPKVILERAVSRAILADGECPHWDYESDTSDGIERACCLERKAAHRALKIARKAYYQPRQEALL